MFGKLGKFIDKLTNQQIATAMLSFSIALVLIGGWIWYRYGGLELRQTPEQITVLTTSPLISELVQDIGGEDFVQVVEVDQNSQPSDLLRQASLVFSFGSDYDDWADDLASSLRIRLVTLDQDVELIETDTYIPAYWTSIPSVMLMSKTVKEALVAVSPQNEAEIASRQNRYSATVGRADPRLRSRLNAVETQVLITLDRDWSIFARDYGFLNISVTGIETPSDVTEQLDELLEQYQQTSVFIGSDSVDPDIQDWASANSVSLVRLASQPNGDFSNFLEMIEFNISQISNALETR